MCQWNFLRKTKHNHVSCSWQMHRKITFTLASLLHCHVPLFCDFWLIFFSLRQRSYFFFYFHWLLHDSKVDFNYRPNLQSGAKWVSLNLNLNKRKKVAVASLSLSSYRKCFTNPQSARCWALCVHGFFFVEEKLQQLVASSKNLKKYIESYYFFQLLQKSLSTYISAKNLIFLLFQVCVPFFVVVGNCLSSRLKSTIHTAEEWKRSTTHDPLMIMDCISSWIVNLHWSTASAVYCRRYFSSWRIANWESCELVLK